MEEIYSEIRETQEQIRCIYRENEAYPSKMKLYPSMPPKLYVKGRLPKKDSPCVAIVGARMCSGYGRVQAFRYARTLSEAGVQIISGMALGIDSEGHKGAMKGGTPTFAVLGSGIDICYPARNRGLAQEILKEGGGLISEYPEGSPPMKYCFPARNRIISAIADAVLVVEAKVNSGSLITAGFALEMGKSVFAIPGPVNDELSLGCHKLIYDGAGIAYSPEVILEELGIFAGRKWRSGAEKKTAAAPEGAAKTGNEGKRISGEKNNLGLAEDLNMVYSCLDLRPKSLDDIIRKTGLPPEKISNCVVELQLLGLIRENSCHYYERCN